jgi:long-chain acyl-CoA synthetase
MLPYTSESISRIIYSIIESELKATRKDFVAPGYEGADTLIRGGGFEVDSLELIETAGIVNEFFQIHETGIEDWLLRHKNVGGWVSVVERSLQKHAARLSFRTSGSTGEPRVIDQESAHLIREAKLHAQMLAGAKRIVSVVAPHHIYGFLWTILVPQELQVPVVDARTWAPGRFARELQAGDVIISWPGHWQMLTNHGAEFPENVRGVVATAAMDRSLCERLQSLGLVGILDSYGSTETAGIGWRWNGAETIELYPWWTQEDVEGLTPDILEFVSERRFRVVRRRDGAVQVSGVNVFPRRVEDVIRTHPAVGDAFVRLMRPEEGGRLKAWVTPKDDAEPQWLRLELASFLRDKLSEQEYPASLRVGRETPRNAMGKAQDWDAYEAATETGTRGVHRFSMVKS